MSWEYYLDKPMDGKGVGWHPYHAAANERLEEEWQKQKDQEIMTRTVWHLQSGQYKYEINMATMEQRNLQTGRVRSIRRRDLISGSISSVPTAVADEEPKKKKNEDRIESRSVICWCSRLGEVNIASITSTTKYSYIFRFDS
mmetsp:Transcript_8888/g.13651  ORF Transcript_8888/g.13651 Transcript_8888/m.13651 type:complete len:142 (-) Transcript_8888:4553-4978(-)